MEKLFHARVPDEPFSDRDQVQAVQNYKNAAHYDLKTVSITVPNGEFYSVAHAKAELPVIEKTDNQLSES
ncbi:MAG: hypothetical protein LUH00_05375 [Lachnospiraceae bacterium]|nr:hypothetical protein [Lachnospiraceae bacterium]